MQRRELFEAHAESLVAKAIQLALDGDAQALRMCLDRIVPPLRENPVSIDLPDVADVAGCDAAQDAILRAVAAGELMPSQGEALAALVEHRRKAIETGDLAARIEALEKALSGR
ncbi:MAG: hypothetical protein KatS3mg123_0278 [Burkholderiales bacterium]|nr:MAG: hypothetical protein KatS3mg123_0278 [Burkholderiales bacterium]